MCVCADQDQVEQITGMNTLLLSARVFNFHLLWPLLPLHQTLDVFLQSKLHFNICQILPKKKFSGSVVFSTVSHVALEADYLTQLSTFRSRNIAKYHRSCTFSRVSTVFLSGVVNGLCWYSSLISRTLGQPLTGWRCAAELPDLSLRVKLRPMSVPNGGPGLFFWNREKDSVWVCCSPVCTCNICVYVPVLYLCSREIMPAAVSEVGRGNVRVLFPLQPLGPHALVAGL